MYKGRFKTDWIRSNIYLKFYDDSDTGAQYFFKPEKFKDRVLNEGNDSNVGKGVKIDFDYFKEVPLNEKESLEYDEFSINNLYGNDINSRCYTILLGQITKISFLQILQKLVVLNFNTIRN